MNNKIYRVAGVMSGTSLDGLDVAVCSFLREGMNWSFKVECAKTFPYSVEWQKKLSNAFMLSAYEFALLDIEYGRHIGKTVKDFLGQHKIKVDMISSHGHTVFHQPQLGVTVQIGNGANITAESNISSVSDFRTLDVALLGQGAPLVPVGDELLFTDYDYCLNIGGFANISYQYSHKRIAYDICPVNILLNHFAQQVGLKYDKNGKLGSVGQVQQSLLAKLNTLKYYKTLPPKSLGREWVEKEVMPLFEENQEIAPEHCLRTLYEHITTQIANTLPNRNTKTVLVTGGGAHNLYLINLLQTKTKCRLIVPEKELVDFKEAIIFAFLGVLRWRNERNCLSSVTGARLDNIGGIIHLI
jgi:anhydro-N-acetylmuramic acid kinase